MKNKEKFAKEIVELACNESDIAVSKATGNPIDCSIIECDCCALYEGGTYNDDTCRGAFREWAESEYIEKPVISKRDRAFLDFLMGKYKYIARDKTSFLYVYSKKPDKRDIFWARNSGEYFCLDNSIDVDFPMVKWEDEEPWLIEDLKKLKVVEQYEYLDQKARIIPDPFEAGEGKEWEATGNIFDNPELIGEAKDGESR